MIAPIYTQNAHGRTVSLCPTGCTPMTASPPTLISPTTGASSGNPPSGRSQALSLFCNAMQRNSCGTARRKALDKCLRKSYTICVVKNIWAYSSAGSASLSLLCPTELWAFKWGVCRLVAQPRHAPKYGPIAQLGERSVRIREVKGSNPSRSTNLPHRFVRCGVFYVQKPLADRAGLRTLKSDANRVGSSMYFLKIHRFHAWPLCAS